MKVLVYYFLFNILFLSLAFSPITLADIDKDLYLENHSPNDLKTSTDAIYMDRPLGALSKSKFFVHCHEQNLKSNSENKEGQPSISTELTGVCSIEENPPSIKQ